VTPATLLSLASTASNVTAGAVLTLVLPLGFALLVMGLWWWYAARRRSTSVQGKPPEPDAEHAAGSTPE
jgi:uncharacterized protein (DUF58 family)